MIPYFYVCSNRPSPRALERFIRIRERHPGAILLYFERKSKNQSIATMAFGKIPSSSVISYSVSFSGVSLRRVFSLLSFAFYVFTRLRPKASAASNLNIINIYCDSIDLLLAMRMGLMGKSCRFRLEASDLHRLQLDSGLIPSCWRLFETFAIQLAHTLIVTSPEFLHAYYSRIFRGSVRILENKPDPVTWKGFQWRPSGTRFLVGYIGILRYTDCLLALVDAVHMLRTRGYDISIRFAGGGDIDTVSSHCSKLNVPAEILGPFQYAQDIQRLYRDINISYAVYDTRSVNVRCAMPNKFYECFFTGIPILVASETYLASRVFAEGIGAAVPCRSSDHIASTLESAIRNDPWYAQAIQKLSMPLDSSRGLSTDDIDHAVFD